MADLSKEQPKFTVLPLHLCLLIMHSAKKVTFLPYCAAFHIQEGSASQHYCQFFGKITFVSTCFQCKPATRDVTMAMNFCFALRHGMFLELRSEFVALWEVLS